MKLLKEIHTHDGLPIPHEYYKADSGEVMMHVWCSLFDGGQLNGQWVLFEKDDKIIDLDWSRYPLAERNGFTFDDR